MRCAETNCSSSRRAIRNGAAIFWCALRFALSGVICDVSAAARGIFSHAREAPMAGKFTPRPQLPFPQPRSRRAISPLPFDFAAAPARVRRCIVDLPPPRFLPAVAPSRCTEPTSPPTGTRLSLSTTPRLPPLASGVLERRPCCHRAYSEHGASMMLAGLLARYAPPSAANIFSNFLLKASSSEVVSYIHWMTSMT
jgi:hypothetical protein